MTVGTERRAGARREAGVAWRRVIAAIATLGVTASILVAGTLVPPLRETATTPLSADVRHETVVTELGRGRSGHACSGTKTTKKT